MNAEVVSTTDKAAGDGSCPGGLASFARGDCRTRSGSNPAGQNKNRHGGATDVAALKCV